MMYIITCRKLYTGVPLCISLRGVWNIFEKYALHTLKEYAEGFSQLPAVTMPAIPDLLTTPSLSR